MKNSEIKTVLLDGYLDEPSCLGVPPYISPHIRYLYGALLEAGLDKRKITYITVDQLREDKKMYLEKMEASNMVIVLGGTTVPGNYLGGQPISLAEIKELGQKLEYPRKYLAGPITLVYSKMDGYDHLCEELAARDLYQILTGKNISLQNLTEYLTKWATKGAHLTVNHPSFPNLICEIETFRGCPRGTHCSFCSEQLKKITYQRKPEEIAKEISALADRGNHHYRLGCQTDLMLYGAHRMDKKLKPNPDYIDRLYKGIHRADPRLKVLHLDNINPSSIVRYQKQAEEILHIIVNNNTPGDTAAFGLESADPAVLKKNNIDTDPQKTLRAVKILNKIGKKRTRGLPHLLPGINFLHGLDGETSKTKELNFQFLKNILDLGLLLRRINIRQVVKTGDYSGTEIDKFSFRKYKKKINREINLPLLKKVFPRGTILENILTEKHKGKLTFGRQLGTYPILVGIPGKLALNQFLTVRVIDHGYRSLTALPWPFNPHRASIEQLTTFPGIGQNKAGEIFVKQPDNIDQLKEILAPDFPFEKWADWFQFD